MSINHEEVVQFRMITSEQDCLDEGNLLTKICIGCYTRRRKRCLSFSTIITAVNANVGILADKKLLSSPGLGLQPLPFSPLAIVSFDSALVWLLLVFIILASGNSEF